VDNLAEVMEMSQITLIEEQEKEGYGVEDYQGRVLAWYKNNQIALLYKSPDIEQKVQETIERRTKELREVEEKTGWKALVN